MPKLRFYTHNIRYAATHLDPGETPWASRHPLISSSIHFNATTTTTATFICLQEVLHSQLSSLQSSVLPGETWDFIGVGREDGATAGEYTPIFYNKRLWRAAETWTVWLSPTPCVPSRGWDAASIRALTVGLFVCQSGGGGGGGGGGELCVMNVHLDDQGVVAREMGAKIVAEEVRRVVDRGIERVVVACDLNSTVDGVAYRLLCGGEGSPLVDLREAVGEGSSWRRYGHEDTYTGFGHDVHERIDFLFHSRGAGWRVEGYAVLENRFDDGVYSSDHRPVVGDVVLD